MPTASAFLLGFLIVVAYVPAWSQPALEPKSLFLFIVGGLAWLWAARRKAPLRAHPWALLLPAFWLLLSALWSPGAHFGLQRMFWLIAALGIGGLLSARKDFDRLMGGFMLGTGIHALLIVCQWIPQTRALLPQGLASDAFQGIGRGLFHNTNMAVQPMLIAVSWLLLSPREGADRISLNLVWLLPAIALTQSRFGTAVCCALLAYVATRALKEAASLSGRAISGACIAGAIAWAVLAHRWGWVVPVLGVVLGLVRCGHSRPTSPGPCPRWALLAGIVLSLGVGWQVYTVKNLPLAAAAPGAPVVEGDASLKQRTSYYRAGFLAFLDRPLWGQGLGAARVLYPNYVDRNRPAIENAYGDFRRPNNLHSEYLELLMEGGLVLLLLIGVGFWLDRRASGGTSRAVLLVPIAGMALLDFPFHNPLGLFWAGICLGMVRPGEALRSPLWGRGLQVLLGIGLLALGGLQFLAASRQTPVAQAFLGGRESAQAFERAKELWGLYPFSADIFDLYSKSAIQSAPTGKPGARELREILALDPWDHHLLLGCAQAARREGDARVAQECLERYGRVAPRDPDRYIRLAKDALVQGKEGPARMLLQEARKQPGFSPAHQQRIEALLTTPLTLKR